MTPKRLIEIRQANLFFPNEFVIHIWTFSNDIAQVSSVTRSDKNDFLVRKSLIVRVQHDEWKGCYSWSMQAIEETTTTITRK